MNVAAAPTNAPAPVDRGQYVIVILVGFAAVAVVSAFVLQGTPLDTSKASAAAGILALVTALAVGIERVLEAFWTLVDRLLNNPSWPFSKDADLLDEYAKRLSAYVKKPLDDTSTFLGSAQTAAQNLVLAQPRMQQDLNALVGQVDAVLAGQADPKKLNLDQLKVGVARLSDTIGDPALKRGLNIGVTTLQDLSGLVDAVITNPGRKILSLFAGALIGLGVAWTFGLDLVHAALQQAPPTGPAWGMVVTGIVVGLGSNPTHELINALQSYSQKNQTPG